MARQRLSEMDIEEVKRLISLGRSDRSIATATRHRRSIVKQIREGTYQQKRSLQIERPWLDQVDWKEVLQEIRLGHPMRFIWEARASELTSYSNFWKAFYQKYPELKSAAVTLREFEPGERCEIDWAGSKVPWFDPKTGQVHEAVVFVGILGFSQLIFATAKENMKGPRFLECHREMFDFFGGTPQVIAPDCLKTGVSKIHRYDPDLNPAYVDLAKHYQVAIVPCRPSRPKDKALVEGAVRVVMRLLRWLSRHQSFTSVEEVRRGLQKTCDLINQKRHTRFRVSRGERFLEVEKTALKPLPAHPFEVVEWREAKLHPDSHVSVDSTFYSAPHYLRGRLLRVKLTTTHIEIFHGFERVALHPRCRRHDGRRVTDLKHLPENARAYRETTPQNLLSQARFLSPDLHALLDELFQADALGHLRRAQGLIREARKEIEELGHERGRKHLARAIDQMKRLEKIRVPFMRELLNRFRIEKTSDEKIREIVRNPSNPLLRYNHKETLENVLNANQKSPAGSETAGHVTVTGSNTP